MSYQKSICSHKTVEAFFLYQMRQVSILEQNEQWIHGVVWDQGDFYSVKLFSNGDKAQITRDGKTMVSPYLTPYALAVVFASQSTVESEIIKNPKVFSYILPFILKMQREYSVDILSYCIDDLFERVDLDYDQRLEKILVYLELYHIFELYAEVKVEFREFCLAMMDECMYAVDRLLEVQIGDIEQFFYKMILASVDRRFELLWKEPNGIVAH